MSVISVSGTATGSGTLSTALVLRHVISGTVHGAGSVTTGVLQTLIFGAQLRGSGTLLEQTNITASGTAVGTGSVSTSYIHIVGAVATPMVGTGTLRDISPLPVVGYGFLTGYLERDVVPPPICDVCHACRCRRCHSCRCTGPCHCQ